MNIFQRSIQRTREKLYEYGRLKALAKKRALEAEAKANVTLELFLDELQQETGIDVHDPKNAPIIALHLTQFLRDRKPAEVDEDDRGGMGDHAL
jgi:FKBP-type peptidyl-prolyl cis-trans isomerase (trigger factor)